jgi:hypothetical protein
MRSITRPTRAPCSTGCGLRSGPEARCSSPRRRCPATRQRTRSTDGRPRIRLRPHLLLPGEQGRRRARAGRDLARAGARDAAGATRIRRAGRGGIAGRLPGASSDAGAGRRVGHCQPSDGGGQRNGPRQSHGRRSRSPIPGRESAPKATAAHAKTRSGPTRTRIAAAKRWR